MIFCYKLKSFFYKICKIFLPFMYCTSIIFAFLQNRIFLKFDVDISYKITVLKPDFLILNPLDEIKNWIPAPIPQYSPPPFYPVIKVNDLSPISDSCLNDSNPEVRTVFNFFTNALVFKNGKIFTSTFIYKNVVKLPFLDKMDPIEAINIQQYEVIEQAIPFFHPYLPCYYHFIIESFPLLLIYNQKTIQNSVLIHNRLPKNHFNELISIFNLKFRRILCVGAPVFVKKLFIPIPHPFDECDINALRHFRYLLFKKTNTENLKATQNVYYNRPKNRLILNFNDLKNAIKKNFPNEQFIEPSENSLVEQINFWRKTKFAMAAHGSIATNAVFMHQNTAYLEFSIKECRSAYIRLCKSIGIHLYEMKFKNHFLNRSMLADIQDVILIVKSILKMLQSQNFSN